MWKKIKYMFVQHKVPMLLLPLPSLAAAADDDDDAKGE